MYLGARLFCLRDQAALTPAFLGETRVMGVRHQNLNCTQARNARLVSALVPFPLDETPSREKIASAETIASAAPSSVVLRTIRHTPEAFIQLVLSAVQISESRGR
jgi:hypothetical protein